MPTRRDNDIHSAEAPAPAASRRGPRRLIALLRAVCGAPAGLDQRRRGSFLVLVVGTLALMALITVVYVSVGTADRRTSSALAKFDRSEDVPNQVADYIAGIIGDDVLDTLPDGTRKRRETWDYPSTAWTVSSTQMWPDTSTRRDPSLGLYFNPIGTHGDDPWLASTEPTWLAAGVDAAGLAGIDRQELFLYRRDWLAISNIAPDGRYVNLKNLRNNFAVPSGFNPTGATNKPYISDNLTLLEPQSSASSPPDGPNYVHTSTTTDFGMPAKTNRRFPAVWGQRQVGAFREVYKGDTVDGTPPKPDEDWYPDNQWADTDGDGFYDARWQELIDARDIDGDGEPDARSLLSSDGRYRYFVSTRIIDLSGLINVNTATDFRAQPQNEAPAGMLPSDIDLRRLLTLRDAFDLYSADPTATDALGYNAFKQPPVSPGQNPADYSSYLLDEATRAGGSGYDALLLSMRAGLVPSSAATMDKFSAYYKITDDAWKFDDIANGAKRRAAHYRLAGLQPDGVSPGQVQGQPGYAVLGTFGLTDQLDLLTYRTANNPAMLTRLEQALGGRDLTPPVQEGRRRSPLRDNRGLDVERDITDPTDPVQDREAMLRTALDVRQYLTTISGARPLASNIGIDADLLKANEVRVDVTQMLKNKQALELTRTIASALMPDGVDPAAWEDPTTSNGAMQRKTLFYGGQGPELALRISAHLAVNMIDSYDKSDATTGTDTPSAYTLLLDRTPQAKARLADADNFPWWNDNKRIDISATGLGAADLMGGALAHPENIPPGINIYGVEAQPFLAEVASFTAFTDAPTSQGGDDDGEVISGGGPMDPEVFGPITINGDVNEANSDFLFRVVAFQLYNPFDTPVKLSTGAAGDPYFYIEFGDQIFLLAEDDGAAAQALTIGAGETLVCYAASNSAAAVAARLQQFDSTVPPDFLSQWAQHQLGDGGTNVRVVQIPRIGDVSTGTLATGFNSLSQGTTNRHARLWKAVRTTVEPANPRDNDILVDRMRLTRSLDTDVVSPTERLDQQFTGNHEIDDTTSGPEGTEDNTGFTITLFASVRRPTAAEGMTGQEIGPLPPWCIEPRSYNEGGIEKWNKRHSNSKSDGESSPDAMDRSDFISQEGDDFSGWLLAQLNDPAVCETIGSNPRTKTPEHRIPKNADNVDFKDLVPEITLNNNEFKTGTPPDEVSTLRATDLLLTWGIGPYETPLDAAGTLIPRTSINRWTTLSEAMALSMKYYGSTLPDPKSFEAKLAGTLDHGSLRLDAYAPFFDKNTDGVFTPDALTASSPREERRGMGVPLAMNLLEMLRGMPETTVIDQYGGLAKKTLGVINVNTAPVMVLRMLPMLSPTSDPTAWWWTSGQLKADSDIAATLVGYRDKIPVPTRPDTSGNIQFIDFRNRDDSGTPAKPYDWAAGADQRLYNGRSGQPTAGSTWLPGTGIEAIREDPGFRSLGEILAARRVVRTDTGTAPTYTGQADPNNIDFLGYNTDGGGQPVDDSHVGVDSVLHHEPVSGTRVVNDIGNEYAEKLAVAAGISNLISVRSDVYAVWFVLRGYQQSDVENLRPEDPMRPSIERRYVMVVDRSNVIRRGDRPQVLLFKEVPM